MNQRFEEDGDLRASKANSATAYQPGGAEELLRSLIIRHANLYTPYVHLEDAYIIVEDGVIMSIGREPVTNTGADEYVEAGGLIAAPGLIDTHIHGIGGRDFMEGSYEALASMSAALARHGVTSFVPTTVSATPESILKACESFEAFRSSWRPSSGARPLGIHLEGPYIAPSRAGAHDRGSLRAPSAEELRSLISRCGSIREITVAPELPGAIELIAETSRAGLVVQVGHTDATYEQVIDAIAAGATKATHLFDAMRPFHHRDPGPIAALLLTEGVYVELIADLVHVRPEALRLAISQAGVHRVVLVTDAMAAADMPDGDYTLGGVRVVVRNGVATVAGTNTLAGSTLTLDRAVRNLVSIGVSLQDALIMATANPARAINADVREGVGVLRPGMKGDIILLDRNLNVVTTIIEGEIAYDSRR